MAEKRSWVSSFNYAQSNPILNVDPNGALDDRYINNDGSINSVATEDAFDRFYVQNKCTDNCGNEIGGYNLVAQLDKDSEAL